jgi:hypothetical protein
MEFSQNELDKILSECGADLIGYADLTECFRLKKGLGFLLRSGCRRK